MIVKLNDPDELLTLRVQYVVDTDPFNSLSMYPAPTRAPTYSFVCTTPLATQLGAILRLLGAPQKVRDLGKGNRYCQNTVIPKPGGFNNEKIKLKYNLIMVLKTCKKLNFEIFRIT